MLKSRHLKGIDTALDFFKPCEQVHLCFSSPWNSFDFFGPGLRRLRVHLQGGDAEVHQQLRVPERGVGGGGQEVPGRHRRRWGWEGQLPGIPSSLEIQVLKRSSLMICSRISQRTITIGGSTYYYMTGLKFDWFGFCSFRAYK